MNLRVHGGWCRRLLSALVTSLAVHGCVGDTAPPQPKPTTIFGRITDVTNNAPVAGAQVTTNPVTQSQLTDNQGYYTISNVAPGKYEVQVAKAGYETGTTSVTAEAGKENQVSVALHRPAPAPTIVRVVINPPTSSVEIGGKVTLQALPKDSLDKDLTGRPARWSTSNPAIARIDETTGQVEGVSVGSVTITASVDGKSGTAAVSVVAPVSVRSVTVVAPTNTAEVGGTLSLTATPRDINGQPVGGRTISWSSSSNGLATISSASGSSATIAVMSVGTVVITATCDGQAGSLSITITDPPRAATVSISPSSDSATIGQTRTLTVTVRDGSSQIITRPVTWASSNIAVATVSANAGTTTASVTAVAAGTASITATSDGRNGSAQINVRTVAVPGGTGLGETAAGEIKIPGERKDHTFSLTVSQYVNVFFQPLDRSCLQLSVISPSGNYVGGVYVTGPSSSLQNYYTGRDLLSQTGVYTIRVQGCNSGDIGRYQFQVYQIARTPEKIASTFAIGDSVSGEDIGPVGDLDEFTFSASTGQYLNVYFQPVDAACLLLNLIGPNGYVDGVSVRGPSVALQNNYTGRVTLTQSGTYTVQVLGCNDQDVGRYRFTVQRVNTAPEAVAATVAMGDTISGEQISPISDIDDFTFQATNGQDINIFFQVQDAACLYLNLYSPTGGNMGATSINGPSAALLNNFIGRTSIKQTGAYTIRVWGCYDRDVGRYRFVIHRY
jgi:uncharacterized protein YjdB